MAGMHIGIVGDSMARQLFQRFTLFFRTREGPAVDAYWDWGGEASYSVNEHEDCLCILNIENSGPSCKEVQPTLKITHVGEKGSRARDWKFWAQLTKEKQFTALIVLNGYWYQKMDIDVAKLAEKTEKTSPQVTTPTFILSVPSITSKGQHFTKPNMAWKRQAERTKNLFFVDFDNLAVLAHNGSWRSADDHLHYMCSGYPHFLDHKPITYLKAWREAVNAYNCDDPVNAALVETILTVLSSHKKDMLI